MTILKENKGVIIFYLMLAVFTLVLIQNAKLNTATANSYVLLEK